MASTRYPFFIAICNPNPSLIFILLACRPWGVAGAILAVPMLAALKILCDHIESLTPIGEFLGT